MYEREESIPQSVSCQAGTGGEDFKGVRTDHIRRYQDGEDKTAKGEKEKEGTVKIQV